MRKSTALVKKVLIPTSLVAAMMMVGCGDKSAGTSNSANIDPSVLAETQELVINNSAEPESLDPHKVSGVPEAAIIRQMLVGLTTTDPDGKTIPGMAESWAVSYTHLTLPTICSV